MLNLNFNKEKSFAIDLGNNNTLLTDRNNVLLSEPSYIVLNRYNNSLKAVGGEAYNMFEKTHENLKAVKPMKGGVIADFHSAEKMLGGLVDKIFPSKLPFRGFDHIISGIPYYATEVERRALRDALEQFNSRKKYLIFEPLAAAMGIGLNIEEPDGKFIVDIGGGITEIVVISLSGIVSFNSIRTAGDTFDEEIQDHFRRNYNLAVGLKTAEQIKIRIGAVREDIEPPPAPLTIKGKDLVTGIPITKKIDHKEIFYVIDKSVTRIENTIVQTLETCPPELASDIYYNGIHVTGGNALLRGLKERFEARIQVPVHIDYNAFFSVSKGIARILQKPENYNHVLMA